MTSWCASRPRTRPHGTSRSSWPPARRHPDANRLGDNIELETPGTQTVTYTPNFPVATLPVIAGVTFSQPATGGGQFNDASNASTVTATQYVITNLQTSSPGGAENFIYAGEAGNDTLIYNTPANANAGSNVVYTPGANPDAGTITGTQVGGAALTPLTFSNLGTTGPPRLTSPRPTPCGRTVSTSRARRPATTSLSMAASGGTIQIFRLQPGNTNLVTVPITAAAVNTSSWTAWVGATSSTWLARCLSQHHHR